MTDFPFKPENNPKQQAIVAPSLYKPRLKEARSFIEQTTLIVKKNKQGYLFYSRKDNPELFQQLELCGFFDFHCTNKQKTVAMVHQVNKFIFGSGWKYYLKGHRCKQHEVEVHHLDGDVTNNNPRNLCYVSPQLNKLCAQACNLQYYGKVKKIMVESMAQAASVVAATVKHTHRRLYGVALSIPAAQWLMQLPTSLRSKANVSWSPHPLPREGHPI